jgi:hypothetical protein
MTTKEKTSLKVHKSLKQKYIYIQLTNRSGQNLAFSSVWSFLVNSNLSIGSTSDTFARTRLFFWPHDLLVNTPVRIKIYREFYHSIIYITNERRHVRSLFNSIWFSAMVHEKIVS